MSPSPAERFSALLARSGERGWSPDDDDRDHTVRRRGRALTDAFHDTDADADDCADDDFVGGDDVDEDDSDDGSELAQRSPLGVRPGISRAVLLCLLGGALTVVLVLVLAPSLLRGESPLEPLREDQTWEAAHGDGADSASQDANGQEANGPDAAGGGTSPTQGAPSGSGTVVVHVVGAVAHPGVVDLPASARVSDAVSAAGGTVADADVDALNLARVLVDGEQIRVPRVGEDPLLHQGPGEGEGENGRAAAGVSDGGTSALINLNTADLTQLETLPGVGPVTAQAIIDHRDAIGRFGSVEELLDVTGIGDATLARLRDSVTVG